MNGIFDKRINKLHGIATKVNALDDMQIDMRIEELKQIMESRTLTFEEQAELNFICLKVLTWEK